MDRPDPVTKTMDLPLRLGRRMVQGQLHYSSTDPYAVKLTLSDRHSMAEWSFARELLRDGCDRHVGELDVQIWPGAHHSKMTIQLGTPKDGEVEFEASRVLVALFAARIFAALPAGHEHEWLPPVDDELAEMLNQKGEKA